jgi:valyl-tRNA synthetase
LNLVGYTPGRIEFSGLPVEDRWILSSLCWIEGEVTKHLERFEFSSAASLIRDLTWNEFCDWYVEFLKERLRDPARKAIAQRVLSAVLDYICRLLHPIMPFVTEQVWQALAKAAPVRGIPEPALASESVCIAEWPAIPDNWGDVSVQNEVELWQRVITSIRNLRSERNVPASARITPMLVARSSDVASSLRRAASFIVTLTNSSEVAVVDQADRPTESAVTILPEVDVILPLANLIDRAAENARHKKTLTDIDRQVASLRAKLANAAFVSNAPAEVVEQTRAKLTDLLTQRTGVAAVLGDP